MADNVELASGSGGAIVKTDEDTGDSNAQYQRVKITDGTENAFTNHLGVYAEDAAHTTGDTGLQMLVVRRDADTTLVGTDGDYAPLQVDANGYLKVEVFDGGDVHSVDWNGTAPPIGAGTEAAALRVTVATDSTGVVSVDDGGGALTVDNAGTFATQATLQAGTAEVGKLAAGVAEIGNVKNSGTFVVQEDGAALTALQLLDDAIVTDDAAFTPATTKVNMAGFEYDDTTPDSVDEGDAGAARMSANRNIYTQIRDAAGNERGANVNASNAMLVQEAAAMDVSAATVTVDNGGTFAVQISDTSFAVADGNALGEGVLVQGDDGTDRKNIHVDATTGDVQVDVTNTVTVDLGANNDVTIDGSSVVKAADSVAGGTDDGIPPLAIRDDALSALTPIEGDYVPLRVNSTGALHVTGGGGGTQYNVDDAAGATDTGTVSLAIRDDALTTLTPIDGDYAPLRVNSTGALHVTGGGGGTEYAVDDALGATPTGSVLLATRDDALTTLTPVEGDAIALRTDSTGALWVATDDTIAVDATGSGDVPITLAGEAVVLGAGTAEIGKLAAGTASIGTLGANSGVDIGDVDVLSLPGVAGDVAHDGADSGNPVKIGAKATNSVEGRTQVANNDRTDLTADLNGVLITRPHTTLEEIVTYHASNTAGTEIAVTGLDAGGAGIHNYVTTIIVHNAHASTNGFIQLLDGSGGTVLMTIPNPSTGGSVVSLPVPLKQTTANTALYWDGSAAITTVYVTIIGFQAQG